MVTKTLREILRDFNADGVSSSGAHQPSKFDFRQWGDEVEQAVGRARLSGNLTFYVRTDGIDTSSGLVNAAGGAFLTGQRAIDVITNTLDLSGFNVTVQFGAGTYAGNITVSGPYVGNGSVTLLGDLTTPGNVIISGAITVGVQSSAGGARLFIGGLHLTQQLTCNENSILTATGKMEYAATSGSGDIVVNRGGEFTANADYSKSGNIAVHLLARTGGRIVCSNRTITLVGNPVFSAGFVSSSRQSQVVASLNVFSGSTGASSLRYALATLGFIDTVGGGANYFPGNIAGTNDGSGVYA